MNTRLATLPSTLSSYGKNATDMQHIVGVVGR